MEINSFSRRMFCNVNYSHAYMLMKVLMRDESIKVARLGFFFHMNRDL